MQTSVPNEFQSARDFFYGVIVTTEISTSPFSFSFAVFFSVYSEKLIFPVILFDFLSFWEAKKPSCKTINKINRIKIIFTVVVD